MSTQTANARNRAAQSVDATRGGHRKAVCRILIRWNGAIDQISLARSCSVRKRGQTAAPRSEKMSRRIQLEFDRAPIAPRSNRCGKRGASRSKSADDHPSIPGSPRTAASSRRPRRLRRSDRPKAEESQGKIPRAPSHRTRLPFVSSALSSDRSAALMQSSLRSIRHTTTPEPTKTIRLSNVHRQRAFHRRAAKVSISALSRQIARKRGTAGTKMMAGAYYVRAAILSPSPVLGRSLMWAQPVCRSAAPDFCYMRAACGKPQTNKAAQQTRLRSLRAKDRAIAQFLSRMR